MKSFMKMFNDMPTEIQRIVYQHLFNDCIKQIGDTTNKAECSSCENIRRLGYIEQYDRYGIYQGILYDKICETCYDWARYTYDNIFWYKDKNPKNLPEYLLDIQLIRDYPYEFTRIRCSNCRIFKYRKYFFSENLEKRYSEKICMVCVKYLKKNNKKSYLQNK